MTYKLLPYISETEIEMIVSTIAYEIDHSLRNDSADLVLLIVLKGGFMFGADLSRKIKHKHSVEFIRLSSYGMNGTQQKERVAITPIGKFDFEGKNVVIVEDMIDKGKSTDALRKYMSAYNPKSVKVCAFTVRDGYPVGGVDYYGRIANSEKWLAGYGLDLSEEFRHIPYVAEIVFE